MVHVKEDDSGSLLVVGVFIDGISVGLNLKVRVPDVLTVL